MPFVSTGIPKLVVAANKVANLPRRAAGHRELPLWDPEICSPAAQNQISKAFDALKISNPVTQKSHLDTIRDQGGDWIPLANLMATKTVNSVSITCDFCRGAPTSSDQSRQSLQVCMDTGNWFWLVQQIVIEVVHLCGGTDLDAYAIANFCFSIDKSGPQWAYYSVSNYDKAKMCAGGRPLPAFFGWRAGQFTVWDNVAGNLWPSQHTSAGIAPSGPSLIPIGGPRAFWQYNCPP
jgi:hypothetical protein